LSTTLFNYLIKESGFINSCRQLECLISELKSIKTIVDLINNRKYHEIITFFKTK